MPDNTIERPTCDAYPACPKLVGSGGYFCPEHEAERAARMPKTVADAERGLREALHNLSTMLGCDVRLHHREVADVDTHDCDETRS